MSRGAALQNVKNIYSVLNILWTFTDYKRDCEIAKLYGRAMTANQCSVFAVSQNVGPKAGTQFLKRRREDTGHKQSCPYLGRRLQLIRVYSVGVI